jgi:hydroxymethylbilane synthase
VAATCATDRAECEFLKVVTTGDRQAEWSLEAKGGKGLFTLELEAALLRGEADLAVHSAKDLPGEAAPGWRPPATCPARIPGTPCRRAGVGPEDRRHRQPPAAQAGVAAFPGTSASWRSAGTWTRGSGRSPTRHMADGTILAAAGLKRLGIASWPGVEFHAAGPREHGAGGRAGGDRRPVPRLGRGAVRGALDAATARGRPRAGGPAGAGRRMPHGARRHATAGTLYLFHEDGRLRTLPSRSGTDLRAPADAAADPRGPRAPLDPDRCLTRSSFPSQDGGSSSPARATRPPSWPPSSRPRGRGGRASGHPDLQGGLEADARRRDAGVRGLRLARLHERQRGPHFFGEFFRILTTSAPSGSCGSPAWATPPPRRSPSSTSRSSASRRRPRPRRWPRR